MTETWLLLDMHYLAHRAFFAMGDLRHEGVGTGVAFGIFRDLKLFQELHNTNKMAFCFDKGKSLRCQIYPAYKANRGSKTEQERKERDELNQQIDVMRQDYLPRLGYKNIFAYQGYEADDIIAAIVEGNKGVRTIIISSDKDLYQLISQRTIVWHPPTGKRPGKAITEQAMFAEYGCGPDHWVDVKAIAGCSTDNIEGIAGIGEVTAAKYVTGKMLASNKNGTPNKAYHAITKGGDIWNRNLQLTRLPLPGTPVPELRPDAVSAKRWQEVMDSLGMSSLRS